MEAKVKVMMVEADIDGRPNDVNEPLTTEIDLAFQSAVKSANRGGPYIMCKSTLLGSGSSTMAKID